MARSIATPSSCPVTRGEADLERYASADGVWRELGIGAPARRALVNAGVLSLEDLRKFSEDEVEALHGMGPKALGTLHAAMRQAGVAFRGQSRR